MRPSSKALGKRKASEDSDEPGEISHPSSKVLGKRKACDNADEPPKTKCVAKASKPGTSKAKVKAEPGSKAKQKGHATGSHNFSSEEIHRLLHGINKRLPIGGKGWEAVAEAYNSWATKQGYSQCTAQPIKGNFDMVSKEKPTGDAECSDDDPHTIALEIEDRIMERSGTLALDDPEFSEGGMKSDGDSDDDHSVIEISTDSEKENHGKGKKGLLLRVKPQPLNLVNVV
ncbi:hypothetical protein L208DRAFT_1260007 [Tricholoma matsutake]|nr:hypothetical protein L208DRAFT_1260007 [Tricholoma matsutake 945]